MSEAISLIGDRPAEAIKRNRFFKWSQIREGGDKVDKKPNKLKFEKNFEGLKN